MAHSMLHNGHSRILLVVPLFQSALWAGGRNSSGQGKKYSLQPQVDASKSLRVSSFDETNVEEHGAKCEKLAHGLPTQLGEEAKFET